MLNCEIIKNAGWLGCVIWKTWIKRLLADDMGWVKPCKLLALLVLEREQTKPGPTLLIAPTSVIGNCKRIEKFAPQLTTLIHHGSDP